MNDGNYKCEFESCLRHINAWKKWRFRKNSRHNAQIQLRFWHGTEHKAYWEYYLEMQVNGKIQESRQITREAFDNLKYDPELKEFNYNGVSFIILYEHLPGEYLAAV